MDSKHIQNINSFFEEWKGSNARFNAYITSHNRFVLALYRPDGSESIGVSFTFCEYISGPTHWLDSELKCNSWKSDYGKNGYEVKDKKAGFLVRGTDTIIVGGDY